MLATPIFKNKAFLDFEHDSTSTTTTTITITTVAVGTVGVETEDDPTRPDAGLFEDEFGFLISYSVLPRLEHSNLKKTCEYFARAAQRL